MKARIGEWQIPDLDFGPRHSGSADLTNMVITRVMTKMVQPVMMPSSCTSLMLVLLKLSNGICGNNSYGVH